MNPSPYPPPFTSAHTRAVIVKGLLVVGAISGGLLLLSEALSLAAPPLADDQEIADNVMGFVIAVVVALLALLNVAITLATVVFFSIWLYRAHDNLPAFGTPSHHLKYSPGWAVGSFFVPFVNLVVPYRAVKEVWQKSVPMEEVLLSEPNPPAWFPFWWLFWLLSIWSGNISARVSFGGEVPESTATKVSIVAGALSIIAAILAYVVVDDIDKRQEDASSKLRLGKFSAPPPTPPPPPADLSISEPFMRQ